MTSHKTGLSHKTISALDDEGKRPKLACVNCRTRKRKCDGAVPSCASCLASEVACNYVLPEKRKGAAILKFSSVPFSNVGLNDVETGNLVIFLQAFEELFLAFNWQLYADASFTLAKEAEKSGRASSLYQPSDGGSSACSGTCQTILWCAVACGAALNNAYQDSMKLEEFSLYQKRIGLSLAESDAQETPGDRSDIAKFGLVLFYDLSGENDAKRIQLDYLRTKRASGQLGPAVSGGLKVWEILGGGLSLEEGGDQQSEQFALRLKASGHQHYLAPEEWKGYNLKVKNLVVGILFLKEILMRFPENEDTPHKGEEPSADARKEHINKKLQIQQMRKYLVLAVQSTDDDAMTESKKEDTSKHPEHRNDDSETNLSVATMYAKITLAAVDFIFFPQHHAAAVSRCEELVAFLGQPGLSNRDFLLVPILWHRLDLLGFMLWHAKRPDAYNALAAIRNPFLVAKPKAKAFLPFEWMIWEGHSNHPDVQELMVNIKRGLEAAHSLPEETATYRSGPPSPQLSQDRGGHAQQGGQLLQPDIQGHLAQQHQDQLLSPATSQSQEQALMLSRLDPRLGTLLLGGSNGGPLLPTGAQRLPPSNTTSMYPQQQQTEALLAYLASALQRRLHEQQQHQQQEQDRQQQQLRLLQQLGGVRTAAPPAAWAGTLAASAAPLAAAAASSATSALVGYLPAVLSSLLAPPVLQQQQQQQPWAPIPASAAAAPEELLVQALLRGESLGMEEGWHRPPPQQGGGGRFPPTGSNSSL
uniref:Zn(2)-C6 fungal-type domain-containing protein n=1 Tax=Heterosigma akashiwo TaxID=2829 RepID=A0A7S3YGK4_HETAK